MAKSFRKTTYEWTSKPEIVLDNNYGMYVNIPFCKSFCSFCPFYKTKFKPDIARTYVEQLCSEIEGFNLPGPPKWIYFGGGTPNILSIDQLGRIAGSIKRKAGFPDAGVELKPDLLDIKYIEGLAELGFRKISIGIESLDDEVSDTAKRNPVNLRKLDLIFSRARSLGLFVNIDLIAGLQNQTAESLFSDLNNLVELNPSQITIYPYMVVRGFNVKPGFPTDVQFDTIEKSWLMLSGRGYHRLSPWTFAKQEGEYDCSKAELVSDYIGFGAGSFSTNKFWKVVNPPVAYYLGQDLNESKALTARKDPASDHWRAFGKMISDLNIKHSSDFPPGINAYISWLRLSGYARKGKLTEKGILLAHHLMKTIVESLPFPLLDHSQISNAKSFIEDTSEREGLRPGGLAESA